MAKRAAAAALVAALGAPVMVPTAVSALLAESVGLAADAPAGIVADKLRDDGRDIEAERAAGSHPLEDVSGCRVYAAVTYQGRRYYVIAEQRSPGSATQAPQPVRCRITTLDGESPRWVDCSACQLVRTYQGREQWNGRRYSGKTITVYPTIGSLRKFRDSQKQGERDGLPPCAACGKRRDDLIEDNEDGLMKCRSCCDIPSE